jgi:hypothetical protein
LKEHFTVTVDVSFYHEALTAAINEACASQLDSEGCSMTTPCPECKALAKAIEARLIRAFIAGQKSMMPSGD